MPPGIAHQRGCRKAVPRGILQDVRAGWNAPDFLFVHLRYMGAADYHLARRTDAPPARDPGLVRLVAVACYAGGFRRADFVTATRSADSVLDDDVILSAVVPASLYATFRPLRVCHDTLYRLCGLVANTRNLRLLAVGLTPPPEARQKDSVLP